MAIEFINEKPLSEIQKGGGQEFPPEDNKKVKELENQVKDLTDKIAKIDDNKEKLEDIETVKTNLDEVKKALEIITGGVVDESN